MHNGAPHAGMPPGHPPNRQSASSASMSNGHFPMVRPTHAELQEMNNVKVTPELLTYIQNTRFEYINDVSCYEKLLKIGQGTFGEVFKARCKRTGRIVALKKILIENEKEGFPITALREVKMLQQLKHDNITDLIEVCSGKSSSEIRDRSTFYLVFAFCEHDLAGLLCSNVVMTVPHVKTLMKHLLKGLAKLHRSKILHRDMKAANILLSRDGVLKLADFGLARTFLETGRQLYTNRVVTLWYRPPELLLGSRQYTTSIDTWGAGCIMAELWTRRPLMQGDTEQNQLSLISRLCGSITPEVWPSVVHLPLYGKMELPQQMKRLVADRMGGIIKDDAGLHLLESLLCLDPSKRLTAEAALEHAYFFAHPHPLENVKDLMDTIKTSQFEYTVGRGPHAGRGRAVQQQQRPPQRPQAPQGHCHDMVF